MSTTICQTCKTYDGIKERRSWNGRKMKPERCLSHADPFATCDVCAVVSPIKTIHRTGYEGKRSFIVRHHQEEFGGPWEHIPTGVALRTYGDRNQYVEDKKIHVCADCAAAVRKAMQVAFDQCSGERTGLRAGVVLDASSPNRVITPIGEQATATTTVTITNTSALVSP